VSGRSIATVDDMDDALDGRYETAARHDDGTVTYM
jgi:hypothetical protein